MTALEIQTVLNCAREPDERRALVTKLAGQLGVTRGTVLRKARAAGSRANGKVRSDAGSSAIKPEHVKLIAGVVAKTQRLNGQVVAPVNGVVKMFQANGSIPGLAASTFCRALRNAEMSKREMTAAPTWRSRSALPGQVFMIDSSTSLQWRFPKGTSGRVAEIPAATQMRMHKPEVMGSLGDTIKRYFVIDHASGYAYGRYFFTRGETAIDTIIVLLDAFGRMGVPERVYYDRGPGNVAFETRYLLWLLGVEIVKKSGADEWTLGRIDNVHNQVQKGLEWRYKLQPPGNIDEMNGLLDAWLAQRNQAVPRAAKRTRHEMLMAAESGTLRQLPDAGALEASQLSRPQMRVIDGRGNFQYHGRFWRVTDASLFNGKQYISVNPFDPATLLVLKDFDMETLQCSARVEAEEDRVGAFGLLESAAPLLHDHPIGARKPAFVGEIKAAKRFASAVMKEGQINPYADLAAEAAFSQAQLARKIAGGGQVDLGDKERTFGAAAAIYEVMNALRSTGCELTDAQGLELQGWHERPEIKGSEIEVFVARAKEIAASGAAQEKTA